VLLLLQLNSLSIEEEEGVVQAARLVMLVVLVLLELRAGVAFFCQKSPIHLIRPTLVDGFSS
jgi:hypothetical protein